MNKKENIVKPKLFSYENM